VDHISIVDQDQRLSLQHGPHAAHPEADERDQHGEQREVEIASTVPVSEESLWVTPCCSLRFTSAQVLAARSAAATCLQRRQR
jgi:hypothetical protein